jgi:hypothetical protein
MPLCPRRAGSSSFRVRFRSGAAMKPRAPLNRALVLAMFFFFARDADCLRNRHFPAVSERWLLAVKCLEFRRPFVVIHGLYRMKAGLESIASESHEPRQHSLFKVVGYHPLASTQLSRGRFLCQPISL